VYNVIMTSRLWINMPSTSMLAARLEVRLNFGHILG